MKDRLEFFLTDDGSPSFRNFLFDEPYHSKAGALLEAEKKYSLALSIWEKENPVVFDVCFGLGYNTAVALRHLKRGVFICFENDVEILKKVLEIKSVILEFDIIKNFIKAFLEGKNTFVYKDFKFIMLLGDVREEIKKVSYKADFVFFDPFSPKKHPALWEKNFLLDVFKSMKKGSKLATYSYARSTRENFELVGFSLKDGPVVGRRSPSLICLKQ
ncbi:MAG: MnmC family methyltransferase [Candidatus Woesearchaeota archaeon]